MTPKPCGSVVSCGISNCFQLLSPCTGQIAHALLTRPPLKHPKVSSLDLHVLGTPPAFVLSQDQTLMFNPLSLPSRFRLSSPKPQLPLDLRAFTLSESDCSFLIYFIRCIVFKDRASSFPQWLSRCSRDNVDDYSTTPSNCQPLFRKFSLY